MKKKIVILVLLCVNACAYGQDVSMTYLTTTKTNAEWLQTSSKLDTVKYSLSNYDKRVIKRTLNSLQTGSLATGFALATAWIPLFNTPITASPALFGRIPANRRLTDFIDLRRSNVIIDSSRFSPENFKHLLEAKRHLDIAQRNSIGAMGAQIIGIIVIANLDTKGFLFSDQILGILFIPASINVVALVVNLNRMLKAKKELKMIH